MVYGNAVDVAMAGVTSDVVGSESADYSGDAYGDGVESGAWYEVMGVEDSVEMIDSGYYWGCGDGGTEADGVSSDSGDEAAGVYEAGVSSSGGMSSSVSGEDGDVNGSVGIAG